MTTAGDVFDRFWTAYPRKEAKNKAIAAWIKLQPDSALEAIIIAAVEARAKSSE